MNKPTAPVVTWARHRLTTDGDGVTTLVIFHGCPLRCRYCLNPYTTDPATVVQVMTPDALYDAVKCDALYFEATGGGITFGGGEPLLYADFINTFVTFAPAWRYTVETSLCVPWEAIETVVDVVSEWIVDIKDVDPTIYRRYTGNDNTPVLNNVSRLAALVGPERIRVRVPLIPDVNTPADTERSIARLQAMGLTRFDRFTYTVRC